MNATAEAEAEAAAAAGAKWEMPYLNSGTILGSAGHLWCVLDQVLGDLNASHAHLPLGDVNDQRWFTRFWLRSPACAALDTRASLFQTLHGLSPDDFTVMGAPATAAASRATPCDYRQQQAGGSIHVDGRRPTTRI